MLQNIVKITEEVHSISDIDILLDKILFEVRRFTNAEAGTIFLAEDDKLRISYTQNEILFAGDMSRKYKYLNKTIPLDEKSMAGFCAVNGEMLNVRDAYRISKRCKYSFNRKFDEASGYRTRSVLTIPLKNPHKRITGVMQIINARDHNGKAAVFDEKDALYVGYFANDASIAIERARETRKMILRMLKMVELRDPKETGGHVNRMGAYAVEIYHQWAKERGFPPELIRRYKDKLRIAAMLHDAGKIAISDKILKKPAKLEPDEFAVMKMHTIYGYRLFSSEDSEVDAMAAEIALHHHEKWDGSGYPGKQKNLWKMSGVEPGPGKENIAIPVTGRIVAIADVYDALISNRIYKNAWSEDRVLDYLKTNAGSHFDPEVVDVFFKIYDIIKGVRDSYKEEEKKGEEVFSK
ncbi:MAG TPA: HD domain-containing protein [Firmicutes bacterium]|nr:HD domain-containing protein [Bacillota bacterium]